MRQGTPYSDEALKRLRDIAGILLKGDPRDDAEMSALLGDIKHRITMAYDTLAAAADRAGLADPKHVQRFWNVVNGFDVPPHHTNYFPFFSVETTSPSGETRDFLELSTGNIRKAEEDTAATTEATATPTRETIRPTKTKVKLSLSFHTVSRMLETAMRQGLTREEAAGTIVERLALVTGNDLLRLFLLGDSTSADASLSIYDGIAALAKKSTDTIKYNTGAAAFSTWDYATWAAKLGAIKNQADMADYLQEPDLAFVMNRVHVGQFETSLDEHATDRGYDNIIQGVPVQALREMKFPTYHRVPLLGVPYLPQELILFAPRRFFAFRYVPDEIEILYQRNPDRGRHEFFFWSDTLTYIQWEKAVVAAYSGAA